MFYSPNDISIGDFWFAKDDDIYHMYYIQKVFNTEGSNDPNNDTLGHAVSKDLLEWQEQPMILKRGNPGSWDDLSLWTGSIIKKDGIWYMLYTGRSSIENGAVQRIGLATSRDLYNWDKYPGNPVMEADSRWYQSSLVKSQYGEVAWRDPFLFYDNLTQYYYSYITAYEKHGKTNKNGCVACAKSRNLINWEIQPPVYSPGIYSNLEVPQIFKIGNYWYLTFCTSFGRGGRFDNTNADPLVINGNFYAVGKNPLGEFKKPDNDVIFGSFSPLGYAGRIVEFKDKILITQWGHECQGRTDEGLKEPGGGKYLTPKVIQQNGDGTIVPVYYDGIEKFNNHNLIDSFKFGINSNSSVEIGSDYKTLHLDSLERESIITFEDIRSRDFIYEVSFIIEKGRQAGMVLKYEGNQSRKGGYLLYLDTVRQVLEFADLPG